jgi:Cu+-exporting ATPase
MTCAACAARVQAKLNRLDGVTASVNLSTERAWVSAPPDLSARALVDVVEAAGYTAEVAAPPGPVGGHEVTVGHAIPVVPATVAAWCRRPAARPGMTLSSAFVVWNSLRLRSFVPRPFNRTI